MTYEKNNYNRDAFTLMEIMLAVVVIGVLASLAMPGILKLKKRLEMNTTKATMAALETGLQEYREDIGHFPNRQEGGLEAIVQRPSGPAGQKWDGPYLKGKEELPADSWGYEFELNLGPAIKDKKKYRYYEIISTGPNGPDDDSDNFSMGE